MSSLIDILPGEAVRALVVVDVQNDFCPGGALPARDGHLVAVRIANALTGIGSVQRYHYAVTTADWHVDPRGHFSDAPDFVDTWPPHCLAGTPGAELHPALRDVRWSASGPFRKGRWTPAYSGFEGRCDGEGLDEWLADHEVTAVDIVGIATDYCVKATALDAALAGLTTRVLLPLTAAVAPEKLPETFAELKAAGVKVVR